LKTIKVSQAINWKQIALMESYMNLNKLYIVIIFSTFFHPLSGYQADDVKINEGQCSYGDNDTCPIGNYCALDWKNRTGCFEEYRGYIPTIDFPYFGRGSVYCSQGARSKVGKTHAYNTTIYALDLNAINRTDNIYAGADGKVIVEKDCNGMGLNCGSKFGNHVIILTDDNFAIMYAHFDKVYVKTGEHVKAGELIGLEGNTGFSKAKHLHWSVGHGWKKKGFNYYAKNSGFLPTSIPFRTKICNPDSKYICDIKTVNVQDISCPSIISGAS